MLYVVYACVVLVCCSGICMCLVLCACVVCGIFVYIHMCECIRADRDQVFSSVTLLYFLETEFLTETGAGAHHFWLDWLTSMPRGCPVSICSQTPLHQQLKRVASSEY